MKFHRVNFQERSHFQSGIIAIEKIVNYPLGNDFFQIDHGDDYFSFFDRLGEVNYYLALDGDRVAAVGAGVLRHVPDQLAGETRSAWYLCDLKVHPDYQRQHLSLRILRYALQGNQQRCDRGYIISMNPDGTENQLVKVLQRFAPVPFVASTQLNLYSLTAEQIEAIAPLLTQHRGTFSYQSLKGIKDLRLQSNGQVLPLLHVQWGATATSGIPSPLPGYAHMFCTPADDALAQALSNRSLLPTATATVVSHNMNENDWCFILTSDI